MFAFQTHPEFPAPVEVILPDGTREDFQARFRSLPVDEYDSFDMQTAEGTEQFVRCTLVGASDITDLDGNPLAFDEALKERMIQLAYLRKALVVAYHKALSGN